MRNKLFAVIVVLMVGVLAHGAVRSEASNKRGAARFRGHRYMVFYEKLSWHDAETKCESLGGHLATITSPEENKFVLGLLNPDGRYVYWLGGTVEETEGVWQWITGEKFSFTLWNAGEPNGGSYENYLELSTVWSGRWNWNDTITVSANAYVCEWDYLIEEES